MQADRIVRTAPGSSALRRTVWRSVLVALAALLLLAPSAGATEVEATGLAAILNNNMAGARNQALLNAQRNAVEQGVGMMVDSRTVSQNFEIIRDKVLTSAQGFVTHYVILDEGATPDGQSYRVKIRATVSENLLKDRLSALRILHKQMGYKRVMVVYQTDNPNALPRNHGATRSALQAIRDEFNKAGFRVFNEAATEQVYQQIGQAGGAKRPVDDLVAMALDQQADLLVRFEDIGGEKGRKGGLFSAAYATVRVSVYATATGRQVADTEAEGKQLLQANAGPYDWEKGLSYASDKAGREAAREAIDRITDYYKQVGDEGFSYLLVFRGFSDDDKDKILDFLETTPGFNRLTEKKNAVNYLEVELFSSQEASRLRRMMRAGLKDKGIDLQTQSTEGNRMIFTNLKAAQ